MTPSRVGAADGGGVGVGGVEQELDGGGALAGEIARVVVGDDHAGVGVAAADGVAELVDRGVVAGELESSCFRSGSEMSSRLSGVRLSSTTARRTSETVALSAKPKSVSCRTGGRMSEICRRRSRPNLVELLPDEGSAGDG